MVLQPVANVLVRGLLSTPGVARGIGKRLITLYVVGRKSGKRYTVPVAYTPYEGMLLIGTPFAWGRNVRPGQPLEVRHLGRKRVADVEVVSDEAGVVRDYAVIARANKNFAGFNKIGFDEAGEPRAADLHRAWTFGARVLRLTLR